MGKGSDDAADGSSTSTSGGSTTGGASASTGVGSSGADSTPPPTDADSSEGPSTTGTGGTTGPVLADSSSGEVSVTCADLILPPALPAVCSVEGDQAAQLTIVNNCESITLVTWYVNYQCEEQFPVATTPPGEMSLVDPTYATHPFRVRNEANNDLMLEIPPLAPGATIVVVP